MHFKEMEQRAPLVASIETASVVGRVGVQNGGAKLELREDMTRSLCTSVYLWSLY